MIPPVSKMVGGIFVPIFTMCGAAQKLMPLGVAKEVSTAARKPDKEARKGSDAEADGGFGEDTDAAVRKFQKAHKLSVDGQAGAKTQAKIKELLSGKVESGKIKSHQKHKRILSFL